MSPRTLLRLYPRAWRERYGDEVLALIEQSGGGWRCTANLIIGAAREWARTAIAPAAIGAMGRLALVCAWELLLASLVAPIAAVAMSFIPYSPIHWSLINGHAVVQGLSTSLLMAAVVIAYSTLCSLPIVAAARRATGWHRHAMFVLAVVLTLVINRSLGSWVPATIGSVLFLWRVTYRAKISGPLPITQVVA